MSIDISVKLMVGLQYSDLTQGMSIDDIEALDEDLDCGEVDYASPYYDCLREDWFVGYETACINPEKIASVILALTNQFELKYNKIPEVQAVAHVY